MYEQLKLWRHTLRMVPNQMLDAPKFTTKGGDRTFDANLLLNVNTKLGGTTVTLRNAITSAKTPTEHLRRKR